jgi:hypothetical protein
MSDLPVGELGVMVEPYGQETETDATRLARRIRVMAQCGKHLPRQSKKTGHFYFPIFHCGYSNCKLCHQIKVENYQARPYVAMLEGKSIRVVELPEAKATDFARTMERTSYLRLPGIENDLIFFDAALQPNIGQPITNAEIDDYDWDVLVTRIPGRKISGKLGKKKDAVVAPDAVDMVVPDYNIFSSKPDPDDATNIITPTLPELYAAAELVYKQTLDLLPTNELTLCTALTIRAERMALELRKHGYQVHVAMQMVHIKLSLKELDWGNKEKNCHESPDLADSGPKFYVETDFDEEDVAHLA